MTLKINIHDFYTQVMPLLIILPVKFEQIHNTIM
jgi:hypothetical protein